MATSLLALIDDIASVLDDVSVLAKVAARKTAGVLGDDLALNAEQVGGVSADRELPVVWAVFKGSLVNKLILVPTALAISAVAPWAIMPLLMLGGLFLCFEGFEKVAHRFLHGKTETDAGHAALSAALADPSIDLLALEKDKIKGAVRTDFILSAEIIVITLGTVDGAGLLTQLLVLSGIAFVMTVGVYGLVAGIVKLDDAGLLLSRRTGTGIGAGAQRALGNLLLNAAPRLMKFLSIAGTIAMFMVGGGILAHGIHAMHGWTEHLVHLAAATPVLGGILAALIPWLLDILLGMIAGAAILAIHTLVSKLRRRH